MNDRAVNVLEQYDIEVLRTWKGRGAILFETKQGTKILKEYSGPVEKLKQQEELLRHIRENSGCVVEQLLPNKEGELYCRDQDQVKYIVKDYFAGRECNIRDTDDCKAAVNQLAKLHIAMRVPQLTEKYGITPAIVWNEFEKHTKELRKVRKYMKQKSQKNDFEIYLLHHFDSFYEQALKLTQEPQANQAVEAAGLLETGSICHGDYQHHNLLFADPGIITVNFEKTICDNQMRDLYLFLRKLMEKNNWSVSLAQTLLEVYDRVKTISREDRKQLYYRFSYPEKFWKIVNFYYNTGKAWIPERNMDKLEKLLKQEEDKRKFIEAVLMH